MPAVSQAQRGYLASNFGEKWMQEHHYNNKGKLPARVAKPMGHTPIPMKMPKPKV